jgi:DNA-directed RNA polymerase subunit H (RpoH/RPB5)
MEDTAIQQLRVILERQGSKIDSIDPIPEQGSLEKVRIFNMGDYIVFFGEKPKIGEKDLMSWVRFATDGQGKTKIVIVTNSKPSQYVETVLRSIITKNKVLYFHIRELQIDIAQHRMFPPHFLFDDKYKKANPTVVERFNRFKIKNPDEELPRIDCLDIGARLVGATPGDIVYIRRHSDTGGYVDYWRRVVTDVNLD